MISSRHFPPAGDRLRLPGRVKLAATILVLLSLIASLGCGASEKVSAEEKPSLSSLHPDLPVITLPTLDFGKDVPRAGKQVSPEALGVAIPKGDFIVRCEAWKTQSHMTHKPAIFALMRRHSSGAMVISAQCSLNPTGDLTKSLTTYEGLCTAPPPGTVLVEVRHFGKAFFVRSANVK